MDGISEIQECIAKCVLNLEKEKLQSYIACVMLIEAIVANFKRLCNTKGNCNQL
jgi:hypothetical protein